MAAYLKPESAPDVKIRFFQVNLDGSKMKAMIDHMPTLSRSDFEPIQKKLYRVHTRFYWAMMAVYVGSIALLVLYTGYIFDGKSYIPIYASLVVVSVPG